MNQIVSHVSGLSPLDQFHKINIITQTSNIETYGLLCPRLICPRFIWRKGLNVENTLSPPSSGKNFLS